MATTLSTLSFHERLLIDENIIHVCEREYDCTVLREKDSLRVETEEQYTELSGINLDFKTKPPKITKETSNHTSQSIRHDSDKEKIVLDQELEMMWLYWWTHCVITAWPMQRRQVFYFGKWTAAGLIFWTRD